MTQNNDKWGGPDDSNASGPQGGWIFAYGSLMWDPGVPVAEIVPASLADWSRSFCLMSSEYRGSPERPGLVLGLDHLPGSHCRGLALRIAAADWPEAIAAIRERELVTGAYREAEVVVELDGGRQVSALTYVVRHEHEQFAGGLCLDEQAAIIAAASGKRGPNVDYLRNFVAHLREMGLEDPDFVNLDQAVTRLQGAEVVLDR